MRLSPSDQSLIKHTVADRVGGAATVRLFGSRTHDSRRGGDIDLLIELPHPVANRLLLECGLAAALERALGGRRVDVLIAAPNVPELPIHAVARTTGVAL
jgi:predicted nucleotidyltransferase